MNRKCISTLKRNCLVGFPSVPFESFFYYRFVPTAARRRLRHGGTLHHCDVAALVCLNPLRTSSHLSNKSSEVNVQKVLTRTTECRSHDSTSTRIWSLKFFWHSFAIPPVRDTSRFHLICSRLPWLSAIERLRSALTLVRWEE